LIALGCISGASKVSATPAMCRWAMESSGENGGGQVFLGLLGKPENTQDFNWGWGKFSFPKKWCFSFVWVVSQYDDPSSREKTPVAWWVV